MNKKNKVAGLGVLSVLIALVLVVSFSHPAGCRIWAETMHAGPRRSGIGPKMGRQTRFLLTEIMTGG
ncbi:MAG: hypothetical protein K2P92_09375, partial [Bdellovibrionaceae bacterium]|nr:hypothetical protein [Pseudobdellovibrionaceae bacterium]